MDLRRYSGVGVLSEIINIAATPKSSCAGINGKGKKTKANAASSFGLAAEIACFQPPKPKVKVAPARQPSRESEQNKLKGKPAVVPSARKHREAEPSKSTGRPRAFAPRSREARASTPKAEPTQALPLEPIEESKALTPPGASLDSRGAAEARTPDISKTTATASDVERKVKLACDSTRKKRNRRKTVCFGDWVTCTPPPACKLDESSKAGKREEATDARADASASMPGHRHGAAEDDASPVPATLQTPPRVTTRTPKQAKTPSHAEILNMSKQLNTLATSLLPETPGTVEKGGPTLKERLAESWCGKSYYERLAEMTSNEAGAEDNEEEDGETIDNLQTKLLEALGSGKPGAGKAKKQKGERKPSAKGRGRRKTMSAMAIASTTATTAASTAATKKVTKPKRKKKVKDDDADEAGGNRRKSWADIVADTPVVQEDPAPLQQSLQIDPVPSLPSHEATAIVPTAAPEAARAAREREQEMISDLQAKDQTIAGLRAELEEAKRKQVVLECQKERMAEEKAAMGQSLERLRQVAQSLTRQVSDLNGEISALSSVWT